SQLLALEQPREELLGDVLGLVVRAAHGDPEVAVDRLPVAPAELLEGEAVLLGREVPEAGDEAPGGIREALPAAPQAGVTAAAHRLSTISHVHFGVPARDPVPARNSSNFTRRRAQGVGENGDQEEMIMKMLAIVLAVAIAAPAYAQKAVVGGGGVVIIGGGKGGSDTPPTAVTFQAQNPALPHLLSWDAPSDDDGTTVGPAESYTFLYSTSGAI